MHTWFWIEIRYLSWCSLHDFILTWTTYPSWQAGHSSGHVVADNSCWFSFGIWIHKLIRFHCTHTHIITYLKYLDVLSGSKEVYCLFLHSFLSIGIWFHRNVTLVSWVYFKMGHLHNPIHRGRNGVLHVNLPSIHLVEDVL